MQSRSEIPGFLVVVFLLLVAGKLHAQSDWIAPEGKIINYRTLIWADFLGKPDKDEDPRAGAAVRPSIYLTTDSAEEVSNNRVKFKFHVKCAFQSAAWVKESVGQLHTYFYLNHEQEHYDIALTFANKMRIELTGRDYSIKDYKKEIEDIYEKTIDKYNKTQESYDNESNHSLIRDMQELWDMRIKKCLENNTDEFYGTPLAAIQSVKLPGQNVKRAPNEPVIQFAVRCRPIYSEISDELAAKIIETKEWTLEKVIIAFYSQKYYVPVEDAEPKEYTRLLACAFMPLGNNAYKRIPIDTFTNEDKPVKIGAVFFANADTEKTKELVILTNSTQRDKQAVGTLYSTRIFSKTFIKAYPPVKLRRLDEVMAQVDGGFDGTVNGKPSKAKYKTEKEVADALKKLGY